MKVIENYQTALENSDERLLKEVFAPQVRIEIPAGANLDQPVDTASFIMSQVAKTAPGIKCTLTADAGNNWHFLGFEGQIEGQKLQARRARRTIRGWGRHIVISRRRPARHDGPRHGEPACQRRTLGWWLEDNVERFPA